MPVAVVEATVMVMVELPAPVIDVGLKLTVTPVGCPEADSVIVPLNPPTTALVIVEVPALPCDTETELGEADRLKLGGTVTVKLRVVISDVLPEVPVTVIV